MLHSIKLANAATVVFIVYFIVLLMVASLLPDLAVMTPAGGFAAGEINWGYLILGLIISAAIIWILVYATISLYNRML